MDFKKLADKAKDTIDKRGGTDALKADAEELKKVAKGKGSLTDKAKAAAATIKDPGARGGDEKHGRQEQPEGEMHPAKHAGNPSDTRAKAARRTAARSRGSQQERRSERRRRFPTGVSHQ